MTLNSTEFVEVEDFRDSWTMNTYKASAWITTKIGGTLKRYQWDGTKLQQDSNNGDNTSNINPQEIFDILNSLKWFQFHFIFSKPFLESEIYTFDYVDHDATKIVDYPQRVEL